MDRMGVGGAAPCTCLGRPLGNGAQTSYKEIAGRSLPASKLGSHKAACHGAQKGAFYTCLDQFTMAEKSTTGIQTPG